MIKCNLELRQFCKLSLGHFDTNLNPFKSHNNFFEISTKYLNLETVIIHDDNLTGNGNRIRNSSRQIPTAERIVECQRN